MAKKNTEDKKMFVVKLKLQTEKWQEDILDKHFEMCCRIYNAFQNKMIKRYNYIENACKKLTKEEKDAYFANYKTKNTITKNKEYALFSSFGFNLEIAAFKGQYGKNGINSKILQYIATRAWIAWEKKLKEKTKKIIIHTKKADEYNFSNIGIGKGTFNGIDLEFNENGKSYITITIVPTNKKKGEKGKFLRIPFNNNKTEYEKQAFETIEIDEKINNEFSFKRNDKLYTLKNPIRCVGIERELIRGKYKYYIVFSLRGTPPTKGRKLGEGAVGIDLGVSTVAAVGKDLLLEELAKGIGEIDDKLEILQQKADRSRRANNPNNYNEDGTCKKGKEITWTISNRGKKINNQIKELYRKKQAKRKISHNELANKLLSYGNEFKVEKNHVKSWTIRKKGITKDSNGKIKSNKRFGKSVGNHAPSMFITILKNKVERLGGTFYEIPTIMSATQYDFTNGEKKPHDLSERQVTLSNGNKHCRDLMAAFNLQHIDVVEREKETEYKYDNTSMEHDYDNFCNKEKELITKIRTSEEDINPNFGIEK